VLALTGRSWRDLLESGDATAFAGSASGRPGPAAVRRRYTAARRRLSPGRAGGAQQPWGRDGPAPGSQARPALAAYGTPNALLVAERPGWAASASRACWHRPQRMIRAGTSTRSVRLTGTVRVSHRGVTRAWSGQAPAPQSAQTATASAAWPRAAQSKQFTGVSSPGGWPRRVASMCGTPATGRHRAAGPAIRAAGRCRPVAEVTSRSGRARLWGGSQPWHTDARDSRLQGTRAAGCVQQKH